MSDSVNQCHIYKYVNEIKLFFLLEMFFFLFYFFEIMNLIKLSNNKFTNKNISNKIPFTDLNKNISLTSLSKENIIYLYCHDDTNITLYNYAQKLSQPFEQVSQSTYKAIVHGYSYYITGMIFISQPTKLIVDFYNVGLNKTTNVLTIDITKQNYYFYISELFIKENGGDWSDNSYVIVRIESSVSDSYIDCSKLYLSNWVY